MLVLLEKFLKDLSLSLNENEKQKPTFYDYIETWGDEGTHRYILDVESERGEVLENIVGIIHEDITVIELFAQEIRDYLKDHPQSQFNGELTYYDC